MNTPIGIQACRSKSGLPLIIGALGGGSGLVLVVGLIFFYGHEAKSDQDVGCFETKSCRPSYRNTEVCEALPIGTPERELVFRLGQPLNATASSLYFQASATERGKIVIDLDTSRKATQLYCHGRT
jgi:hypothetical protein